MYSAFVKLLNMSAASGILIVAVIGLRFLLRKVPKKYRVNEKSCVISPSV